ncbi:tetratricopeptide repeat-containing sensor histidine kinase [Chitinophaga niastensis]|uniref:ATP-binding protein n=1 Tax=Chitinophaga niastensis TaxID=536980 RepID=UPI0013047D93|nr:tetratricopeptide repeat-containing sensor histidine kinase [Chitinophaga niastensis]
MRLLQKKQWTVICLLCYAGMLHARTGDIWQVPVSQLQDSTHYIDKVNHLAVLYQLKNLDSSFLYVMQAQQIATRQGYTKGKGDAWQALGDYYGLRNNSYLSIRYYMDALQVYKKLADSNGISQVYASLGVYHKQSGQMEIARDYLHKAMDIGQRLPGDSTYALILSRFAGVNMEDPTKQDSVQWALKQARNISTGYRDVYNLLQLDLLDLQSLLWQGDIATARNKLSALVSAVTTNGYGYPAMLASRLMAATSARQQQADSIQYLVQAVKLSLTGGYQDLMLPYIVQLYDWYKKQGKQDTIILYSNLLLGILKQRNDAKSNGEMDYIAYYTQQHQMRALQLQRATQQELLRKRGLETRNRLALIGFLFLLLVFTMLVGLYFYRSYKESGQSAVMLAAKNREISAKNDLLHKQDDFKNKLVSVVAHDFRSPLHSIISMTEFLKAGDIPPDEAYDWMMDVERSAGNTLQTFDNILAWINSQLSGFVYIPALCTPADMIPETLQYLADMVNSKRLQIIISIPREIQVWADQEMLQFVHRNFIHNAVKFSPEGGKLYITAGEENGSVTLSVVDEGPGIPESIFPYLFEYPQNNETRETKQGAGLALIICRDFMDKMRGQLQAGNQPGGGAIFSYTLPHVKNITATISYDAMVF